MNEILLLLLAALAGGVLGLFYFTGLWWTVQQGISFKHPGLLFMASFVLRTSIVLGGFYFIADSNWKKMVVCLLGFVIVRTIIVKKKDPQKEKPVTGKAIPVKEANNASES